jgi:hypothetical protein
MAGRNTADRIDSIRKEIEEQKLKLAHLEEKKKQEDLKNHQRAVAALGRIVLELSGDPAHEPILQQIRAQASKLPAAERDLVISHLARAREFAIRAVAANDEGAALATSKPSSDAASSRSQDGLAAGSAPAPARTPAQAASPMGKATVEPGGKQASGTQSAAASKSKG